MGALQPSCGGHGTIVSYLVISDPANSEFGQNLGCIPLLNKPGLHKLYKVIIMKHIKEEFIHS